MLLRDVATAFVEAFMPVLVWLLLLLGDLFEVVRGTFCFLVPIVVFCLELFACLTKFLKLRLEKELETLGDSDSLTFE